MPPITKENEISNGTVDQAASGNGGAVSTDTGSRQQPVAVEVPVNVNGARTVEGSDKREPFSESTKTVLVFGNGAVIRLSSSVAPGQLLFLTNEKTKKEVVCQVVKSKHYRNVSGYVELEFTEPVVGFWGMRFPADRIVSGGSPAVPGAQTNGSPAAGGGPPVQRSIASKTDAAAPSSAPPILPPKPAQPSPVAAAPSAPRADAPGASPADKPGFSSVYAKPETPQAAKRPPAPPAQATLEELTFASVPAAKPKTPPAAQTPQAPVAPNPETAALREHTAQLQDQLSSLMFTDAPTAKPTTQAPIKKAAEPAPSAYSTAKIKEIAEPVAERPPVKPTSVKAAQPVQPRPAAVKPPEPPKAPPPTAATQDEQEKLQIPTWLEPLSRSTTAPTSTQELIEREKAKRQSQHAKPQKDDGWDLTERSGEVVDEAQTTQESALPDEIPTETISPIEVEQALESEAPASGEEAGFEEESSFEEEDSESSGKIRLIAAVAAGVLLLGAGTWWYKSSKSSSAAVSTNAPEKPRTQAPVSTAAAPAGNAQAQPSRAVESGPATLTTAADRSDVIAQTRSAQRGGKQAQVAAPPARGPVAASRTDKPADSPGDSGEAFLTLSSAPPAAAQPEKAAPATAEVRPTTSTAKASKPSGTQESAQVDAAPALSAEQPVSAGNPLGAGLGMDTKGPAAPAAAVPVAIGGNVKPAKILSTVAPIYPALAKNQRISGNVVIDALIDEKGKVTSMKVVSGPALLHQAAMDALKQWKYQPALLDGKPVSMHLSVTLQFRLN